MRKRYIAVLAAALAVLAGCQDFKHAGSDPTGTVTKKYHKGSGAGSQHSVDYYLCVKDKAHQNTQEVCFNVSKAEYVKYNVGQHYPKSN